MVMEKHSKNEQLKIKIILNVYFQNSFLDKQKSSIYRFYHLAFFQLINVPFHNSV